MKRSLYGHTIVAVIVAIAAYVAWTKPKATGSSKITMISGSIERLTAVKYREERWDVAVNRTGDDFAVTVQRLHPAPKPKVDSKKPDDAKPGDAKPDDAKPGDAKPGDAKPDDAKPDDAKPGDAKPDDAKPDDAKPDEPEIVTKPPDPPKTFPASDKVDELLGKLVPLEAARTLGEIDGEQLKAMGLDDPKSKLTLVFGDKQHVIDIGNSTYGSGDLYARSDGREVFLIPSASIGSIRHGASSLLNKNAVGAKREKVTRLTINAGAAGREITQRYSEDKNKRFFSDPAEPEAKLEMVSNWLERMWRLRVVDLLDPADAPPSVIPPAVEVEMFAGPDSLGVMRMWPADDRVARATSTHFDQPFTVSKASAEALLKDIEGVLNEGR